MNFRTMTLLAKNLDRLIHLGASLDVNAALSPDDHVQQIRGYLNASTPRSRTIRRTQELPAWIQWRTEVEAVLDTMFGRDSELKLAVARAFKKRPETVDHGTFVAFRNAVIATLKAAQGAYTVQLRALEPPHVTALREIRTEIGDLLNLPPGSGDGRESRASNVKMRALTLAQTLLPDSSGPVRALTTACRFNTTWKENKRLLQDVLGVVTSLQSDIESGVIAPHPQTQTSSDFSSLLATLVEDLNAFPDAVKRVGIERKKPGRKLIDRPQYPLNDEYDVQDILYVYLKMRWGRVQEETPSEKTAGSRSDIDFVLLDHDIAIEVKFARPGEPTAKLGKELKRDHFDYRQGGRFKALVAFVVAVGGADTSELDELSANDHDMRVEVVRVRL